MQALKYLLDFSKETSNDIDAIDHLVAAFDNVKSEVNINVARELYSQKDGLVLYAREQKPTTRKYSSCRINERTILKCNHTKV